MGHIPHSFKRKPKILRQYIYKILFENSHFSKPRNKLNSRIYPCGKYVEIIGKDLYTPGQPRFDFAAEDFGLVNL